MTDDRLRWALGGLLAPDGSGYLERVLDGYFLFVPPNLKLRDDRLEWRWFDGRWLDPERSVKPGPGLLDEFLDLADGSPRDVLAYAKHWGVLWLCPCTRPYEHRPVTEGVPGGLRPCHGPPQGDPYLLIDSEPVEAWFRYARRARSLLRIASAVARGGDDLDAWGELVRYPEGSSHLERWRHQRLNHIAECVPGVGRDVERYSTTCAASHHEGCECGTPKCYQRGADEVDLGHVLDDWLADCDVRTHFHWLEPDRPEIFVSPNEGIAGHVALQLALAIGRSDALAFCSACGRPYAPKRRPAPGQNHYCVDCGDRARWRDAQRRRRARMRASTET